MLITISGIIYEITNRRSGVSQKSGNSWNSFDLVIETYRSDKFTEFVCVNVFNKNESEFQVGTKVSINVNLSSKKFNEKYFTSLSARDFVIDNGSGKANDQNAEQRNYQRNDERKAQQKEGFVKGEQKAQQEEYENSGGKSGTDSLPF